MKTALKTFDKKWGKTTFESLPSLPGIYRFYDGAGVLIYVGKAKNLRRRLGQYRNAKRCKAHIKMRQIVREAARLEHEVCESEFLALKKENEWIQAHRPKWNVEGAFYFLYPMVGFAEEDGQIYLCYTTKPELHPRFRFHGAYRSRRTTKAAFFALIELLALIGHPTPRAHLIRDGYSSSALKRGDGFVRGFRQVPRELISKFEALLEGKSFEAVEDLALLLLDRPAAVAHGKETQSFLHDLRRFWRHEVQWLWKARRHCDWAMYPVAQKDRDLLFIALRTKESLPSPSQDTDSDGKRDTPSSSRSVEQALPLEI